MEKAQRGANLVWHLLCYSIMWHYLQPSDTKVFMPVSLVRELKYL